MLHTADMSFYAAFMMKFSTNRAHKGNITVVVHIAANADGLRDAAHHALSFIALYTTPDAECDQQVTVVGRLSTAVG